jgi:hypothetical protein
MCYDKAFMKLWAKSKVQEREQIKPEAERVHPEAQPIRPASGREMTRGKEVRREFEEIV